MTKPCGRCAAKREVMGAGGGKRRCRVCRGTGIVSVSRYAPKVGTFRWDPDTERWVKQ